MDSDNIIEKYKISPRFINGVWIPGRTLEIYVDPDPISPRDSRYNDNLGTMVCFNRKYSLGDDHNIRADDFTGWEEIEEYLERERDAVVILPLYLYDHSGLVMNTGGFTCPWDSGQVGFIYVSKNRIENEYGQDTRENRENAKRVLECEVEEYSKYLSGDVYGYVIYTEEREKEDSCWGFYEIKHILEETGFTRSDLV